MRDRLQYVVSKRELLYCLITRFFVVSILNKKEVFLDLLPIP